MSEVDLAKLSEASWMNVVALDELVVTAPLEAENLDSAARVLRCTTAMIMSLPLSLRMTAITIRNPLPTAILQKNGDILADVLAPIFHELDVHLSERIAASTLQRVAFATSRPNIQPLAENNEPRVAQLFPILAKLQGNAV
ncbi:hypothetical protein PsYK624_081040 [Phanerochaete sordida]|uniref:Uncharacterized protein n=1 Tax=Phanerochaete sordida TaxID=48140 RepID=A0A9P3GC75_9APHY|nr:hypothetical protein PsYK624_081040 [Phanerochaete sordida]